MELFPDQKEARVENQEAYQRAKERVEAKIGFYIHLAVYVGVNVLLIMITSPHRHNTSGSGGHSWGGALACSFMA